MFNLDKAYQPRDVEAQIYDWWEKNQLFHADPASPRPPYSIVIPPPNVTGQLHIGHALDNTLQDILCRFKRMRGHEVLWMPGTDHAGIATQNVVERFLATQGIDRHQLGRDKFIAKVWEWKEEYGGKIIGQLKRLGASCDWQRLRFTMDEGLSKAVREVFVQLYEDGLIYRGDYIINWCPRCRTALSDLESEHKEVDGGLYYIKYPFASGTGHVTVATSRPETMLGDVAVAINPEDPRYQNLPGDEVILPLMNRPIPIIKDTYVSLEFGTGALKVTPAHDPNDFNLGRKHGLPLVKIMDEDGNINQLGGAYAGMDRFSARHKVLEDLEALGLLEKQEELKHSVGHCYRCSTMVEPLLSKQWFVKTRPLAEPALEAVAKGDSKIFPAMWEKTYFEWLNNIRDWCISRQIWWGHRIPAWYCDECGEIIVSRQTPETCPKCANSKLRQDEDVLDTWFSSGLWPFSTMGWPTRTPELAKFYPTACLVTGFDILFFWVARMMMLGIKFMNEVPFRHICIHALVRDAEGQKMSKSKGNVMDPLLIIDEFGADAFRFTLAAFAAQGRDIRMSNDRIAGYRNFINKVWNAGRFAFMHAEKGPLADADNLPEPLLEERWIMSRAGQVGEAVAKALDEYRFNEAASLAYQFVWHEFCDWYLELIKVPLNDSARPERQAASRTRMFMALDAVLRLLHPFTPFISEHLWQHLPAKAYAESFSIMRAPWPDAALFPYDKAAEQEISILMETVGAARTIRGEMGINPGAEIEMNVLLHEHALKPALVSQEIRIKTLAKVKNISFVEKPVPQSAGAPLNGFTLYVPLAGLVDIAQESARLKKEIGKMEKQAAQSAGKLNNPGFTQSAPPEVIEKEKEKLEQANSRLERLRANLQSVEGN